VVDVGGDGVMPEFYGGVISADVWGYPNRRLTERFAIIERVPPRYDASLTLVMRSRRIVRGNTRFIGHSNDIIVVGIGDNDLIRRATETILLSGFNPANMKDSDDNTSSNATIDVFRIVDIVRYDLGAVKNIAILFIVQVDSTSITCYLDVSNDGVTYTNLVASSSTTKTTYVLLTSARYVRLRAYNEDEAPRTCYFFTLEAYDVVNSVDILVSTTGLRTLTIISRGYSFVWEVVQL
jgi:glucose-6-phosphate isomerase